MNHSLSQFTHNNVQVRLDWLCKNYGFCYTVTKELETFQTKYQQLSLIETSHFGKALLLDGATQVVEKGEEYYHEPLAHYPLLRLQDEELCKVLIIGGGDGGILREMLRHKVIKFAHLLEIDPAVVKYCKQHFPAISNGAFSNKKTKLIIADAYEYVEEAANQTLQGGTESKNSTNGDPISYDAIVMDMTDPVGPSQKLYTKPFFEKVKTLLPTHGVFAMHVESFYFSPQLFRGIVYTLQQIFDVVEVHSMYIPMYGAVWNMAVCSASWRHESSATSQKKFQECIGRRFCSRNLQGLKAINAGTFFASLAHPPALQNALDFSKDVPAVFVTPEDIPA